MGLSGALVALVLGPSGASAQAHTVRLEVPECESLPFDHRELHDLLAVELGVHRIAITDEGEASVSYEPLRCGDANAPLSVVIERADIGALSLELTDFGARAMALLLAELLRAPPDTVREEAAAYAPSTPPVETPPIEEAPEEQETGLATALAEPEGVIPPARATEEQPPAREGARTFDDVSLVAGVFTGDFLYNPENQSWLGSLRAEVSLRMPFWKHWRVHLDTSFGMGRSDWAIHLGGVWFGFWTGVAVGGPDLSLELGPRVGVLFGWAIGTPHSEIYLTDSYMVALSVIARGALRVGGATSVIADVELGSNLTHGVMFSSNDPNNMAGGGIHDPFFVLRAGVMID